MKQWFCQNKKHIFFVLFFGLFVVQVLVMPSIRPFLYEGREYYVTYRIDGNNSADALIRIPLAFWGMGFFSTLLSYPSRLTTAFICALVPLPVVARRRAYWMAYSDILGNALFNLCFFAIGILSAVLFKRIWNLVYEFFYDSRRRYLRKKNAEPIPQYTESKRLCHIEIQDMLTRDTVIHTISIVFPSVILMLYRFFLPQIELVGISPGLTLYMSYMFVWIPFAYLASGFLCMFARHPRYVLCGASVILLSLDIIWSVFSVDTQNLWHLPAAVGCYLLFYGMGLFGGSLIHYGMRKYKERQRNKRTVYEREPT